MSPLWTHMSPWTWQLQEELIKNFFLLLKQVAGGLRHMIFHADNRVSMRQVAVGTVSASFYRRCHRRRIAGADSIEKISPYPETMTQMFFVVF